MISDRATISCTSDEKEARIVALAPDNLIKGKAPKLRVIYPFSRRSDSLRAIDPDIAFELERISAEASAFVLRARVSNFGKPPSPADVSAAQAKLAAQKGGKEATLAGLGLAPDPHCWTLVVGPQSRLKLPTAGCSDFDPRASYLTSASILIAALPDGDAKIFKDKFILVDPHGLPYEVSVSATKPEAKRPVFDKGQTPSIKQNDARWIEVTGVDLQFVVSAKINGTAIELRLTGAAKSDAKDNLQVNIPRSVSEKPGTVDMTFYDSASKIVDTIPLNIVCTACK